MKADRLPPLPPEGWSAEQRKYAEEIIQGPRGGLISPFVPLLRSPELMAHAQRMGEYLRYRSALGQRISEFVILLVARQWSQDVEWAIHEPIARRLGAPDATLQAIAKGRRPEAMDPEETAVYAFCEELERNRCVADATWDAALELFGEQGVVDLLGLVGYYSFLAMVMNAAQTPAPPSKAMALPRLPE